MKLSIIKDRYKGHARSPWLVVLPARLSHTGNRLYKRFSSRTAAAEYISAVVKQVKQYGEHPIAMLPAQLAADAIAACKLLEGSGMTLCEAVQKLFSGEHKADSDSASCPISTPDGSPLKAAVEPLTLPSLLSKVEAKKHHQSAATHRARRGTCHTLFKRNPGIVAKPLQHFTPEVVQAALNTAWPNSPQAWNAGRRQLHALFAYAIKRRLVRMENPVTCIEPQYVQEAEISSLAPQALRKLLAAARPATDAEQRRAKNATSPIERRALSADLTHLRAYIAVCAFAGIRPAECARLRWQDIDFEDAIISVRAANCKTGGQRHIEMHAALQAWLLACRPTNVAASDLVTPPASLAVNLSALRRRAGFGSGIWQQDSLRHSYATYYLKAGCGDLTRLQLNMGHRSVRLLYSRYVNMVGTTRKMAKQWWQIMPQDVFSSSSS